jgi:hypothetical protein
MPLNQAFPSFGSLYISCHATRVLDTGFSLLELGAIVAMIDNRFEEHLTMTIVVHLRQHIFGNDVGGHRSLMSVKVLNFV